MQKHNSLSLLCCVQSLLKFVCELLLLLCVYLKVTLVGDRFKRGVAPSSEVALPMPRPSSSILLTSVPQVRLEDLVTA